MCSGSVLSGHCGIQSIWQAKLCWALSQLAVSRMESNIGLSKLAEYMESVMMRLNNWLEKQSSKDETGLLYITLSSVVLYLYLFVLSNIKLDRNWFY